MRIAFVYDAVHPQIKGGVERRVWELARLLVRAGCSVEILAAHYWDGPAVLEREGVVLRAVSPGTALYRSSGQRALWPSFRHALGVFRCLRRETYDVIDCQIPAHPAALAAWFVTRNQAGSRIFVTWHEAWGRHWIQEFGWLGYGGRAVEKLVTRLPATHIAVSDSVGSALGSLGLIPAAVIEAGVALGEIDLVEPRLNGDVVFVGRLIPTKNVGLLLDSISLLEKQGLEVTCTIVGDGPRRADLELAADELGLNEHVTFLGSLEKWTDVIATMKGAKVLAVPSVREGFGLVVAEAAACGLPVVTVDHPRNAARTLVVDHKTGLVTSPTPAAFAEALSRILGDTELRVSMAADARAWAEEITWEHTLERTLSVYRQIAA